MKKSFNTFRDDKVHVNVRMCDTCIFRPGNLMSLSPGRVEEMVKESIESGVAIVCHDTLNTRPKMNAVCRGFWNKHKKDVGLLQLAEGLGVVKWQMVKKMRKA
jgi:hypothetical protein